MATSTLPTFVVLHISTVYLGHDTAGTPHFRPTRAGEPRFFVWDRVPLKAALCNWPADNDSRYAHE